MGGRHALVYMVARNLNHLITLPTSNQSLQDDFSKHLGDVQRFASDFPGSPPSKQCVSTVVTAGCFVEQVLGHEALRSNSFGGICGVEILLKASKYLNMSYGFRAIKKHLGWVFLAYWKNFERKVNTVPNTGHSCFQVMKQNILGVNKRKSVPWVLSSNVSFNGRHVSFFLPAGLSRSYNL